MENKEETKNIDESVNETNTNDLNNEEVEENTKDNEIVEKNNNRKKIIIFGLIVIIVVIFCGVGIFLLSEKKESPVKETKTTESSNESKDAESTTKSTSLPTSTQKEEVNSNNLVIKESENIKGHEDIFYWDYDAIYERDFSRNYITNQVNIYDTLKFVKVENDKLMWNIDGKWEYDKNITEDILFIDSEDEYGGCNEMFFVVTKNNLYSIYADNGECDILEEDMISSNYYDNYKYKKLKYDKEIKRIAYNYFPGICEGGAKFYFLETSDGTYILQIINDIIITSLNEFLKEKNLLYYQNTCSEEFEDIGVRIAWDGESNIKNEKGKNIKIKYYVIYMNEQTNKENLHVFIDNNKNVYAFKTGKNSEFNFKTMGLKPFKSKLASFKEGKIKLADGMTIG